MLQIYYVVPLKVKQFARKKYFQHTFCCIFINSDNRTQKSSHTGNPKAAECYDTAIFSIYFLSVSTSQSNNNILTSPSPKQTSFIGNIGKYSTTYRQTWSETWRLGESICRYAINRYEIKILISYKFCKPIQFSCIVTATKTDTLGLGFPSTAWRLLTVISKVRERICRCNGYFMIRQIWKLAGSLLPMFHNYVVTVLPVFERLILPILSIMCAHSQPTTPAWPRY